MTRFIVASGIAVLLGIGSALAQAPGANKSPEPGGVMRMSEAECQAVWSHADASHAGSLTQAQAQPYISDFKAADTNNDGKLTSSEFLAACSKGLVHSSATTGSGSGTTGTGRPK